MDKGFKRSHEFYEWLQATEDRFQASKNQKSQNF
ncbi:uncharacterized protein G2W53_002911 [Senna tora]|uniref:Uncharacterized protein n=1 Tax=Senna tora TaxID=362788 RepID=A0A834XBP4_9FABA|nr:uncharacterized protein G2W53_002911 [Senna tora]